VCHNPLSDRRGCERKVHAVISYQCGYPRHVLSLSIVRRPSKYGIERVYKKYFFFPKIWRHDGRTLGRDATSVQSDWILSPSREQAERERHRNYGWFIRIKKIKRLAGCAVLVGTGPISASQIKARRRHDASTLRALSFGAYRPAKSWCNKFKGRAMPLTSLVSVVIRK
jgi:hypothetical protein